MRLNLLLIAVSAAALALPKVASADVIDDFTIVGNGLDITFSLPASTVAYVTTPHSYWSQTFPETTNGVPGTGSLLLAVDYEGCSPFEFSSLAGIALCGPYTGPDLLGSGGLWTLGTFTPAPGLSNAYVPLTFIPGTYQDTDLIHPIGTCPYFDDPYDCTYPQYTITITPEATTVGATPEPGTLALLSTGLAAGWGLLSRRRVGTKAENSF